MIISSTATAFGGDWVSVTTSILEEASQHKRDWTFYKLAKEALWKITPGKEEYDAAYHNLVSVMEL